MPRRPHTGALMLVLALDLTGVAAVAAVATRGAARASGAAPTSGATRAPGATPASGAAAAASGRDRDGAALTAGAAVVGFATWIPAAIAIGIRARSPRSRRAKARARRLVHLGWTANTAGTLSVAALASSAEGPGSRPAVLAGALALGGAAASAAYLELL